MTPSHYVVKTFYSGRDPVFTPVHADNPEEAAEKVVALNPGAQRARIYAPVAEFDVKMDWGWELTPRVSVPEQSDSVGLE